jgi:SOUL heme-binding protein
MNCESAIPGTPPSISPIDYEDTFAKICNCGPIDAQDRDGSFMKLFRYISGANGSEQKKISMTTPHSHGLFHAASWKHPRSPPRPQQMGSPRRHRAREPASPHLIKFHAAFLHELASEYTSGLPFRCSQCGVEIFNPESVDARGPLVSRTYRASRCAHIGASPSGMARRHRFVCSEVDVRSRPAPERTGGWPTTDSPRVPRPDRFAAATVLRPLYRKAARRIGLLPAMRIPDSTKTRQTVVFDDRCGRMHCRTCWRESQSKTWERVSARKQTTATW